MRLYLFVSNSTQCCDFTSWIVLIDLITNCNNENIWLLAVTSQQCFKSLETNKHQNYIFCKCCEWGPGLGFTSHCQPSALACEKTKTSFSFSRKYNSWLFKKKKIPRICQHGWIRFLIALIENDIQLHWPKFNGPKPALSFFEKIFLFHTHSALTCDKFQK